MPTVLSAEPTDRSRRAAILTAAEPVFVRYGYRKTSMDDVAKAADVSRQGLYVHFAKKEDLFREMIRHGLGRHLEDARAALADADRPIGDRLVDALNEWFGTRDKLAPDSDLPQASVQIAGLIIQENNEQLEAAICTAIRESELQGFYEQRGVTPTAITAMLMAASRGINTTPSSETFKARLRVAVSVLIAPLRPVSG